MKLRSMHRLGVALLLAATAAMAGNGPATSQAADPGTPPQIPANFGQLESKIQALQQFLQRLRQERQSRPPRTGLGQRFGEGLDALADLEGIWSDVWERFDELCQQGAFGEPLAGITNPASGLMGSGQDRGGRTAPERP